MLKSVGEYKTGKCLEYWLILMSYLTFVCACNYYHVNYSSLSHVNKDCPGLLKYCLCFVNGDFCCCKNDSLSSCLSLSVSLCLSLSLSVSLTLSLSHTHTHTNACTRACTHRNTPVCCYFTGTSHLCVSPLLNSSRSPLSGGPPTDL